MANKLPLTNLELILRRINSRLRQNEILKREIYRALIVWQK